MQSLSPLGVSLVLRDGYDDGDGGGMLVRMVKKLISKLCVLNQCAMPFALLPSFAR